MSKTKTRRRAATTIVRSAPTKAIVVQAAPRRRRAAAVVRRAAGAARRGASRAFGAAKQRDLEISAVAGAAALGFAEGSNDSGEQRWVPPTISGFDPALVWGGAAVLLPSVAPKMFGGKMMKRLSFAGLGILCVGVARSMKRGSAKVSGEDDDD
jgi:hypothetical protein